MCTHGTKIDWFIILSSSSNFCNIYSIERERMRDTLHSLCASYRGYVERKECRRRKKFNNVILNIKAIDARAVFLVFLRQDYLLPLSLTLNEHHNGSLYFRSHTYIFLKRLILIGNYQCCMSWCIETCLEIKSPFETGGDDKKIKLNFTWVVLSFWWILELVKIVLEIDFN